MTPPDSSTATLTYANAHERLDAVLAAFNNSDGGQKEVRTIHREGAFSWTEPETADLVLKLERDGYISWMRHSVGGVRSDVKAYFRRNVEGMVFGSQGGYVKNAKRQRRDDLIKKVETWAVIIGGIGGGVALLYLLRKLYVYVLCCW